MNPEPSIPIFIVYRSVGLGQPQRGQGFVGFFHRAVDLFHWREWVALEFNFDGKGAAVIALSEHVEEFLKIDLTFANRREVPNFRAATMIFEVAMDEMWD